MNSRKLFSTTILTSALALCYSASALNMQQQNYKNVDFVVVEVSENDPLNLYWKNTSTEQPYRSLSNLIKIMAKQKEEVLFAINSGIFAQNQSPLGLHVEKGQRLHSLNQVTRNNAIGNFSLIPNGVFFVDDNGKRHVLETEQFLKNQHKFTIVDGTQSGPMLLIDGKMHPKFYASSDSLKYRSGVCVHNDMTYFVVTQSPINFYYFAKFFQDQLSCQNALYLDGTLSQLYYRNRYYGAPFWYVRPYVGIWSVTQPLSPAE